MAAPATDESGERIFVVAPYGRDAGLTVDVYDLRIEVSGSFTGSDASLLSVHDPKARGTASGAGFVVLPNGNTAQFAFSAATSGSLAISSTSPRTAKLA